VSPQKAAAQRFLAALGNGDVAAAAAATSDPTAATVTITRSLTGLGTGTKGAFEVVDVSGPGSVFTVAFKSVVEDCRRAGAVDLPGQPSGVRIRHRLEGDLVAG
jgi:hypothetical protein